VSPLQPFGVGETHGIVSRPGNHVTASSDGCQWTAMFASIQRENPYEAIFAPANDQLIVLHRDGPVRVERTRGPHKGSRLVPAGGLHLVPNGMEFGVRLEGVLSTMHVYVRRSVIEEVAADILEGDPSKVEIPPMIQDVDPSLHTLLEAVAYALESSDTATALYSDYLARAIAAQLLRGYSGGRPKSNPFIRRSQFSNPVVANAVDFMRENLDRAIDLVEIADAVNRSPSHVARMFRMDLGMPPHKYLINLRVERAKMLLDKTSMPIVEIAYDCGFSHQEHLTRLFKRYCGITPAAYRKSRRS